MVFFIPSKCKANIFLKESNPRQNIIQFDTILINDPRESADN